MQRDIPATSVKLRESAATLCARHCVVRLGSQHVCATKRQNSGNPLEVSNALNKGLAPLGLSQRGQPGKALRAFPGSFWKCFLEFLPEGGMPRDCLSDTPLRPPVARSWLFGVSTWPIRCTTPSRFSEGFPLGEHAKWRCVSQQYLRENT